MTVVWREKASYNFLRVLTMITIKRNSYTYEKFIFLQQNVSDAHVQNMYTLIRTIMPSKLKTYLATKEKYYF